MSITIEEAREARGKARSQAALSGEVSGVGITTIAGEYAVKVNFRAEPDRSRLPSHIDGVAVVYDVTGAVKAL